MLYHLLNPVFEQFKYITFRSALAAVVAFGLCLLLGPGLIAFLTRKKIQERVEKKDAKELTEIHRLKANTPTLGGLLIVAGIVVGTLLFGRLDNPFVWLFIYVVVSMAIVGFVDDYIKLTSPTRHGLSRRMKLLFQGMIGLIAGFELWLFAEQFGRQGTALFIPFLHFGDDLNLGFLYPFFAGFVIVACSNAVNITDGLDGLAAGLVVMASLAYAIISYLAGRVDFAAYLHIPYISGVGELTVAGAAVVGASLGFLWYNAHPAQIFMGDTGSLALGGAIGIVALSAKQEVLLFVVGALFVLETLSSLLQILYFKATGKRLFRIAPYHHALQYQGLHEVKITVRFWIVAAILALMSLAVLKLS
ncbi:MAG: phospho-N-acetylmuramoyl-pentapeptide-transferase [Planctomycetes bacterium]|nr:phospho-N-acetylmuramoyl-pentapeptide-transferase [Planctomycetota bacterium]